MKLLIPILLILLPGVAVAGSGTGSFVDRMLDEAGSQGTCITLTASDDSGSSQDNSKSEEEEEPDCE